jgi:hypothetical protein
MNRKIFAGSILILALASVASVASGQESTSSTGVSTHYTQAEMKQLASNAQTPEQYLALASYFGKRQKDYLQLAAEEKQELARRSQNIVGVAAKYPRPVDSARNLYEYYMYKASEVGTLSAKFVHLATPDRAVNAQ